MFTARSLLLAPLIFPRGFSSFHRRLNQLEYTNLGVSGFLSRAHLTVLQGTGVKCLASHLGPDPGTGWALV